MYRSQCDVNEKRNSDGWWMEAGGAGEAGRSRRQIDVSTVLLQVLASVTSACAACCKVLAGLEPHGPKFQSCLGTGVV